MAWDEAPPTATELAPATSSWDATPPTPEELKTPWSDVPANAVKDVAGLGKALAGTTKTLLDPLDLAESARAGSLEPTKEKVENGAKELMNMPGEMVHGVQQFLKNPAETFREHPVNTALGAAGVVSPALGALGKGAEVAEAAIPAAQAAEAAPIAEEAAVAPKEPIAAPTQPPSELPSGIKEFLEKQSQKLPTGIPEDVKQFVGNKAQKIGETPVGTSTAGKYAQEHARNMAMKSLGASPGQIRKIGVNEAEKLADYAFDKGIVNIKTGDIGAREKIAKMKNDAGQVVGDMRQLAAQRGAIHDVKDLLTKINSKLGDQYESGIKSGEKSSYIKALEEVAKTPPTPDKIANTITQLFQKAKNDNAALNVRKLGPPIGPYADVARELRSANEELLSKTLSPKELNTYHNALEDYGANTQLQEFVKMKQARDMGGRLPPGMGAVRAVLQKGLDTVGYRGQAQIVNNVSKWLRENPKASLKAKDIFRKYIDEAAEAADEVGEGLQ